MDMRDQIVELAGDDELLFCDGFDGAIIGVVERFGQEPIVLYDRTKYLAILMERDGMSYEAAEEFFGYNVIGAWVGDKTPAFATIVAPPDAKAALG